MRIVHATSVHPRDDVRIFQKQLCSIAAFGHEAVFVVADGRGAATVDGVLIHDVGAPSGRLSRVISTAGRVARHAATLKADIVQLHDPELLAHIGALRGCGARVIFDSHEDVPRQILSKHYLPKPLGPVLAAAVELGQRFALGRLDGLIAATPEIGKLLRTLNPNTVDIRNFPNLSGFVTRERAWHLTEAQASVLYAGSITETRGAVEAVEAMARVKINARLDLFGAFAPLALRERLAGRPGWDRVKIHGRAPHAQVRKALADASIGLVTLHPTPAYLQSWPIKMFEYMAAGLPIVASDFPLWRRLLAGVECAVFVDPRDPDAIAAAIDAILSDRERMVAMGRAGRAAAQTRFSWESEESRLLAFYDAIGKR